jgi:regulatory protein
MSQILIVNVRMMKLKPFCIVKTDTDEFSINNDLVYKYRIEKGRKFSEGEFDDILFENDIMTAKKKAYEYASYSPRSEKKVRLRLEKLNYNNIIIEKCIEFLYQYDLLNDETYAKKYINDYLLKKKAGRYFLINKLIENGISQNLAEITVNNNITDNTEREMIAYLLSNNTKFNNADERKTINKLINRGFSIDNIKSVLEN